MAHWKVVDGHYEFVCHTVQGTAWLHDNLRSNALRSRRALPSIYWVSTKGAMKKITRYQLSVVCVSELESLTAENDN